MNFVTCHDGFTLNDLVSYDRKHNEANGEQNRDGCDDNRSWNCGVEGPTDDPAVENLRNRQVKNLLTVTMLSIGLPMIVMGDEGTLHNDNCVGARHLCWLRQSTRPVFCTISSSVSAHPAQLVLELTPREWKRRWRDSAAKAAAYGVRPRRLSGLSSVGAITGNDRCVRQLRLM